MVLTNRNGLVETGRLVVVLRCILWNEQLLSKHNGNDSS